MEKSPIKTQMKDRLNLSPLFSRISPVLKRRSPSPIRERSEDCTESSAVKVPLKSTSLESFSSDLVPCAMDSVECIAKQVADVEPAVDHAKLLETCSEQLQQTEKELSQLKEEKLATEKQLVKSREEVEHLSNLVKDMEHKWTEVAKDYEKQVSVHSFYHIFYIYSFMNVLLFNQ